MAVLTIESDVNELQATLNRQEPIVVLDIRPADEWEEWSIPGSQNLPVYVALKDGDYSALEELELPANTPVTVVCRAGSISQLAADFLRSRGHDARSLAGGMKAWSLAWNTAELTIPGVNAAVVQTRRTGKGCLSYLVGSAGEAVVIDPALDPAVYLSLTAERGWRITDVLETHVHADHLSRGRGLAELSGAAYRIPETDRVAFANASVRDGDVIKFGAARLTAMRTPGHTLESTTYLLGDRTVLTGDTLFVNAVGRPDLEASPDESRHRAHLLWESLRRLLELEPDTLVLPGHTSQPASFDGEVIAATLNEISQRLSILALRESAFVDAILSRIPPTPPNHSIIVGLNEVGDLPDGDSIDLEAGANRCAIS